MSGSVTRVRKINKNSKNSHVQESHIGTIGVDTPTFFEQIFHNFDPVQDDEILSGSAVEHNRPYNLGLRKWHSIGWGPDFISLDGLIHDDFFGCMFGSPRSAEEGSG